MRRYSLSVSGMHCAACAEAVAKALAEVPRVHKVQVNFATERALVEVDEGVDFRALAAAVEQAGYRLLTRVRSFRLDRPMRDNDLAEVQRMAGVLSASLLSDSSTPTLSVHYLDGVVSLHELQQRLQALGYSSQLVDERTTREPADETQQAWQRAWVGLGLSSVIMALTMVPSLMHQGWARWTAFGLATFVLVWVGAPFFRRAVAALRRRTATMDTLVSLGALSAYGYSLYALGTHGHLYFDSAAFILSAISLGKGLEHRARTLATAALQRLVRLLPSTVIVLRNGTEQQVPLEAVTVGDLVLVRSGERIPVDGLVVRGRAEVDESLLTGESAPVVKSEGDEVLGGSLCLNGFLQVEALRVGDASFAAQLARLMDEAQATKPAMQRLADRVAAVFVPLVLLLATATFVGWLLASGDGTKAMLAAVSVLVIACPCAMGLATPTAVAVALGRLSQWGLLVRNAEAMEKAADITTVVLDKTGTVTEGQMQVVAVWSPQLSEERLLTLAASAEQGSLHPIAHAITQAAVKRGLQLLDLVESRSEVGAGISAKVQESNDGNLATFNLFVGKVDVGSVPPDAPIREWSDNGWSVVGVWQDGVLLGCLALADALRLDAAETVQRLRELGVKVILATGDRPSVAIQIAQQLGCDEVFALATPQRKAQLVQERQAEGERVLVVGDGVNDAVALAQADVGIAFASGADLAAHAADALLVADRLSVLADFLRLARHTKRVMKQNLFWAFAYNMAALPLAALGKLNPMIAAVAMALSSVTVVSNALRLRRL